MKRGEWRPNPMTNLTDPALAPLVARYRAWVEAENENHKHENDRSIKEADAAYEQARQTYYAVSYRCRSGLEPFRGQYFMGKLTPQQPTYQGFLDWAIREGIEAPKGGL